MKNTEDTTAKTASLSTLTDDEKQFIHEIATLLAPRGLSPSAGRVYGYLLLKRGPVDVDEIAADLEMSRVGAWNSARNLETYNHVRRSGTPGSKRVVYTISDDFGAPLLEQVAVLGTMGKLLQHCSQHIAGGDVAEEMQERSHFYFSLQTVMQETIESLNAARATKRQ